MNVFHRWYCRSAQWKNTVENEVVPWALEGLDLGNNVLEIGSGPGLTTDVLRRRFEKLTCLEINPKHAESLRKHLAGSNVTVRQGDGTRMPFENGSFSGVVSFTMMHHIPSVELQDQMLKEVQRVLIPGGVFAGTDSLWSRRMVLYHIGDTMTLVDQAGFPSRLAAAGFENADVEPGTGRFRFRAFRPMTR
jgi:SAM-dependent methyltransferase